MGLWTMLFPKSLVYVERTAEYKLKGESHGVLSSARK